MANAEPNPYLTHYGEPPAPAPEEGEVNPYLPKEVVPTSPHPGFLANNPDDSTAVDIAKNVGTGLVKGAAGTVLDMPNMFVEYLTPVGGIKKAVAAGADALEKRYSTDETRALKEATAGLAKRTGIGPSSEDVLARTGEYVPETALGRIGQTAVAGAIGGLGPTTGIRGAAILGRMAGDAAIGGLAGGVGGATRESAATVTDNPIALGAAELVGNLGTAVGAHTLARTGAKALDELAQSKYRGTAAGQGALAGHELRRNIEAGVNPEDVAKRLETPDFVPGSDRLTGEKSGSKGLARLDRELMTGDQDYQAQWVKRLEDNQTARQLYAKGLQQGDPMAVQEAVKNAFDRLTLAQDEVVNNLRQSADVAGDALGRGRIGEQVGPDMRVLLRQKRLELREPAQRIFEELRRRNKNMEVAPIITGERNVYGNLTDEAKKSLSAAEQSIRHSIGRYGDVMPYQNIRDLEANVNTAIAKATPGSPEAFRLGEIKDSIRDAVAGAAKTQAERDAEAVLRGQMKEQDTFAAVLRKLEADIGLSAADAARDGRAAAGAAGPAPAGSAVGDGAGAAGAEGAGVGRAPGVRYLPAAGRKTRSGPPDPPVATFTDTDARDLSSAISQWRNQARIFDRGSVGAARQKTGRGDYVMDPAKVPGQFFKPGETGGTSMDEYLEAAGDDAPRAIAMARDYAIERMRAAATNRETGLLDPKKLRIWAEEHANALDRIPDLRGQMRSVESAERAVADAAKQRKIEFDTFQKSAAGKFLGAQDPITVRRLATTALEAKDGPAKMRSLMAEMQDSPDAVDGLRKAVIEQIYDTKDVTGATFQNYLKNHREALQEVFTPEQMRGLDLIAADIGARQQTVSKGVRLPGNVNTAADLVRAMQARGNARPPTAAEAAAQTAAAGPLFFGFDLVGVAKSVGSAVGLAKAQNMLHNMRNAGMDNVDDLIKGAMLDPKLAAVLLRKPPPRLTKTWVQQFTNDLDRRLVQHSLFATSTSKPKRDEKNSEQPADYVWRPRVTPAPKGTQ